MTKPNTSGRFFKRLFKSLFIMSAIHISSLSGAIDTDTDGWTLIHSNTSRVIGEYQPNNGRGSKTLSKSTEKHFGFDRIMHRRLSEKREAGETLHELEYRAKIGSDDADEAESLSIAKQFSGIFSNSPKVSPSDVEAMMQMEHTVSESIVFLGAMAISAFSDLDDLLAFGSSDDWTSGIGSTDTASIACRDQGGYSGNATRTDYRKLQGILVAENCKAGGITADGSLSWDYDEANINASLLTRPHPFSFTFTNLTITGPQGQIYGYSGRIDCDFGYISPSYTLDEALLSTLDGGYFSRSSFNGLPQPELNAPNCDFRDVAVTFNNTVSHTLDGLKFISYWNPFQTGATSFGGEDIHYMLTIARSEMLSLIDVSFGTKSYMSVMPDMVYTTTLGNLTPQHWWRTTSGSFSQIANSDLVSHISLSGHPAGTYSWEASGEIGAFGWTIEGAEKIPVNKWSFDWIDALRSVSSNGSRCALLTNHLTYQGQDLTDDDGETYITLWEERILKPGLFSDSDDAYSCKPINSYWIENGNVRIIDFDGDGISDSYDSDDDNDGYVDRLDAFPFDSTEHLDTDEDSLGNNTDTDDDGDGISDADELVNGTDPLNSDSDSDSLSDGSEAEIGTNPLLEDTDGDDVNDQLDQFPLDASESVDTDSDGIGNNSDLDDDGDGASDVIDAFPLDSSESLDTDSDGIGNNSDGDDDADGVSDANEAINGTDPLLFDTDGDGLSDGQEALGGTNPLLLDSDEDGVNDKSDMFPLNRGESQDLDGDGIGNNSDNDDDGDNILDIIDNCALISNGNQLDTDDDLVGNVCDGDDDNDNTLDSQDAFPLDATESLDTDSDSIGNNADTDDDGDGISDAQEYVDGTDPLLSDTDSDGLSDSEEVTNGTNPLLSDTDGDGFYDGYEVSMGADPLDGDSFPRSGLNILLIKGALDIKKAKEENCAETDCANNE